MKEFFFEETVKTVDDFRKNKGTGIKFALLSDTKLCDTVDDTIENIKNVDSNINFDFIIHMGNFINGNNPKDISMMLLNSEFNKFRNAVGSKRFYPVQGKTDGYRDERFCGQLALNIMTDRLWNKQLGFFKEYDNISRPDDKPYYYVDYAEQKVRIVVLCAYSYQIDESIGYFDKYCGIDAQQAVWLKNDALNPKEKRTVIIFSNAIPKSRFEIGEDPFIYNGYSTEPVLSIIQQAKERGTDIACWFSGGYGYDCTEEIAGINFAVINSQIPTVKCNKDKNERRRETKNQDCWDAVVLNTEERKIKLFRFGCGEDRVITY
ncbi:MAG: metallophosphoesterase [Clostridia bacterium]|nr:metallophosphoesterase [Clostridia bacterium]